MICGKNTKVKVLQFASFPENNKGGSSFPWIHDHGWGEKSIFIRIWRNQKQSRNIYIFVEIWLYGLLRCLIVLSWNVMVFVFDFDWVNNPGARWPRPWLLCAGSRVKRPRWLFWLIYLSFCLTSNIYVVSIFFCINTSCNQQSTYRSSWLWGPSCHLCWPCCLSGWWFFSVNTKYDFIARLSWNIF